MWYRPGFCGLRSIASCQFGVWQTNHGAKAFVNFNGMNASCPGGWCAIRASYNIAGVFRNLAGDYTVYFQNPMPDANYLMSGSYEGVIDPGTIYPYAAGATGTSVTLATTTAFRMRTTNQQDATFISAIFFR